MSAPKFGLLAGLSAAAAVIAASPIWPDPEDIRRHPRKPKIRVADPAKKAARKRQKQARATQRKRP